jgi:hypothetical protein
VNGKRHLWFPVVLVVAAVCLFCGENKGTEPDGGFLFAVELEHYFSSYDAGTSQVTITADRCGNASNDSSVVGLEVSGEWIMVHLDIPEGGRYTAYLSYASRAQDVVGARLEMDGCGTATATDFLLTDGSGTG